MKTKYFLLFFIALITTNLSSQTQTFTSQVSQSTDDAEESQDMFDVLLESSDLELVYDDFSDQNFQTVGIRFTDILIPNNAIIESAYIQFHADDTGGSQTDLLIRGEATAFSQTFSDSPLNISSRSTTFSSTSWSDVPEWSETHLGGLEERSPDISNLVAEMISNNEWAFGNPLTFIITGTGSREAESFDGVPEEAPILIIDYTIPQANFDLAITDVEGIVQYMFPQDDVAISTTIENSGQNIIETFEVSYYINDVLQSTETINQPLEPGKNFNLTFGQKLDLLTTGNFVLDIRIHSDMDNTEFNNSLQIDFEVIPLFSDIYFESNSVWKYLDDGTNQSEEWINMDFDDSNWSLGAEEFGFGDGDEHTLLNTGSVTYYFRKQVEIQDIDLLSTITANISSDDAIVLYINGQEVSRSFNLPSGEITATTTPDRDVPHDFENKNVSYDIPISYFTSGINTIAVELHNLSANDPDLSFNCEFTDDKINYSVDGPYVINTADALIVKNITEDGPIIETYPLGSTPQLTCDLPNGDSFSFDMMDSHVIPSSEYEMPNKFLVTSDIEGQIEAYIVLLQNAGVIDLNYNWTYGNGHLYFIGDMFDRGNYVTQCLWLLYKLEQEAVQVGGQVHFIVGNHEVLNFEHDFRYVRDKYFENAHHMGEILYDLYDANTELGAWLRSKNIIENAGNSAIFLHAGLSPQVNALNLSYDEINDFGRLGMDSKCNGNIACQVVNGGSDEGVYWYRGIANEELSQVEVDDIVSNFNGEALIFGHSVFPEITPLYNHKALAIDVDHGDNFDDGFMEALHYENGCYYRLTTNSTDFDLELLDEGCISLSATDIEIGVIKATPSVFRNYLTITSPQNLLEGNIKVHTIFGNLVASSTLHSNQNTIQFNSDHWINGTYIITLKSEDKISTVKATKI